MKAGAPLIVCPLAGRSISKKIKSVCMKFKAAHGIDVKVYERGWLKIGNIAKSDPLSPSSCDTPVQVEEEEIVGKAALPIDWNVRNVKRMT